MKFDMSGGAAVIEAMGAIAELGIPVKITAVVPSTENMPSGRSVKPGDIVTAMNGTTIEVNNTDAEGRLILADALAYAVDQGAERLVDLATLTGAIIVALGSTYAGLFSNDDDWSAEVGGRVPRHRRARLAAAAPPRVLRAHEGPVRRPHERLERAQGDARSTPPSSCASSWTASRGCTWTSPARPGAGRARTSARGASGYGVRTLVELAQRTAAATR